MFGKRSNENTPERHVMVHIRSGSIEAAIVDVSAQPAVCEYSIVAELTPYGDRPGSSYTKELITTLQKVVTDLIPKASAHISNERAHMKIKDIHCIYGAPWYESTTKKIVIKKDKPFVLKEPEFKKLVKEQLKLDQYTSKGFEVLEQQITQVVLNGYELQNPFDKETKELTIDIYASFVQKALQDAIRGALEDTFHNRKIEFHTYTQVVFSTFRKLFPYNYSGTVCTLSAELLEFTVIENAALSFGASAPVGKNKLVDLVAKAMGADRSIAESEISQCITKQKSAHPGQYFDGVQKKILQQVGDVLQKADTTLPPQLFVVANQPYADLLKIVLSSPAAQRNIFNTEQQITTIILQSSNVQSHVKTAETNCSPLLLLLTAYLLHQK